MLLLLSPPEAGAPWPFSRLTRSLSGKEMSLIATMKEICR
jgi:hypothetical protein